MSVSATGVMPASSNDPLGPKRQTKSQSSQVALHLGSLSREFGDPRTKIVLIDQLSFFLLIDQLSLSVSLCLSLSLSVFFKSPILSLSLS